MAENIKDEDIVKSYVDDMAKYSIVSNLRRNIPDVRDGLKPVQRRILHTLDKDNRAISLSTKVKSSSIVGSTMGKYHPHGDSSIYDAIKPMTNWFQCKEPLISGFGNWGAISGAPAAASRYTEAYLSKFGLECVIAGLHDSDSVVDWQDNYDGRLKEPEYLPAIVPLLLVNGASGIGVGVSTDIPTHNLSEVIDATINLIKNPKSKPILIPDHCLPCDIINTDWERICETGNGSYKARALIKDYIDQKGYPIIEIYSIPEFGTDKIQKQIENLVLDNKLPQIHNLLNNSKLDVDIKIILKKGSDIEYVKQVLYKYTDCEKSFRINFEAVRGMEHMRFSYKGYLLEFIEFTINNKYRMCSSILSDTYTKMHMLEAYIKTLESGYIEDIIKMIRKRKETGDAELIEFIVSKAKITDIQARFIIDSKLKNLSIGYLEKFKENYNSLKEVADYNYSMITNENNIKQSVIDDLIMVKSKYGKPRISNIINIQDTGNIPQGNFRIVFTENNYIRKLGINDPVNTVRGDKPRFVLDVQNLDNILIFDNKGKVFSLPVHKIPMIGKSDPGLDVRGVVKGLTADIVSVIYEPIIKDLISKKGNYYLAVLTENNNLKKLDIKSDLAIVPPSGIIYTKVDNNDRVVYANIVIDSMDVIIYSGHKALRISSKEIPIYKRNAYGVGAMNSKEKLDGIAVIYPNTNDIVVLTKNGYINKFPISGMSLGNRNKSGMSVIKLSKNDSIFNIFGVNDNDILTIETSTQLYNINIQDIMNGSSISPGNKIIPTKSDVILSAWISR